MLSTHFSSDFQTDSPRLIKDALQELVDDLARKTNADGLSQLAGIGTGFSDLDHCISGIRPGSLVVIASRPSMGKTTLVMNIAAHVALNNKMPVLVFSMDLSAIAMASRLVSYIGKIETRRLRTGDIDKADQQNLDAALNKLKQAPLYIDETNALTVEEIIIRTRYVSRQWGGLGLIVIDYLQLIEPIGSEENSAANYEETMHSLKALAREINTPIILLSQLSQELEMRKIKKPNMSDLPARVIGQYSDLLMFLYRDEVYSSESEDSGSADVIVTRNRFGSVGTIRLKTMNLRFSEFSNFNDCAT
jgi:replicative DNA helicase